MPAPLAVILGLGGRVVSLVHQDCISGAAVGFTGAIWIGCSRFIEMPPDALTRIGAAIIVAGTTYTTDHEIRVVPGRPA